MKYSIKKYIIFLAVLLTGCVLSDMEDGGVTPLSGTEGDGMVTITVNIPGTQTPVTRSIAGSGGEAHVKTVDILVFKNDGTLSQHAEGKNISNTVNTGTAETVTGRYTVQFQAKLDVNSAAQTVAIIANAKAETASVTIGNSKADILEALTFSQSDKWNTNSADYTPIPMYGEYSITSGGITAGMKMENILLTRMVARVDVTNNATANFELSEVWVVGRQTAGYIAPAWDTADGAMLLFPYTPMIPTSSIHKTGQANALKYDYVSGIMGDIYLFESPAASGNEGDASYTDATCLILYGTYNGTDYYYRVDFTAGKDIYDHAPGDTGFDPSKVAYMPVYRNHLYNFTVTAVNGVGHTEFADALGSRGIMNNLKTTLQVVDQSRVKNIVFDNEHYLGIESTAVDFDWENGGTASIFCTTNHPSDWQMDTNYGEGGTGIEYTGTTGWLTTPDWLTAQKSGTNHIALAASGGIVSKDLTAKVHIRAGNLTGVIDVTMETMLLVGRFGGTLLETKLDEEWKFEKKLYIQGRDQGGTDAAYQWGPTNDDTGVRDYWDGKGNTWAIRNATYPAANACFTKNGTVTNETDANYRWYLPAQRQLMAAWVSNSSFDTYKPSSAGYRSATESDASNAWNVNLGSGNTTNSSTNKPYSSMVRCVREVN